MIARREILLASLGFGVALAAGPRAFAAREIGAGGASSSYGAAPGGGAIDQTATLQAALDQAARSGTPFFLPPGLYATARLVLKSGTQLRGVPGQSILRHRGGGALLSIEDAKEVRVEGIVLDGNDKPLGGDDALLIATGAERLEIRDCRIAKASGDGVALRRVSGRIANCDIGDIRKAALFSEDARGLEIANNHVHHCGDNGILVWRSSAGEDGTIVSGNRIERIAAESGGSGQNGNGVNVFRAGSVLITGNRIADCAFSAIRSNSGSNCQMLGNSCERLGEVALYAEFAFEGAVIASNIVNKAATGIAVTNFDEGGRLAIVQGNLVRNLFFRKDADTRGNGIAVEADAAVTGNVVENAPGFGIVVGWMRYLRDVNVTANLIRNANIGIGVSADDGAGRALIADNLISGAKDGAIRAMDGPRPVGPDLAHARGDGFRNLSLYANVAR